jgi:Ca2+-binding RTX toxin-like protein
MVGTVIFAGLGDENILGGNGSDTVSYVNAPRAMLINLIGQVTADGVATDTLIENAVGSAFNDVLYGDGGNNVLDGGPGGSDQISGGAGSDTVSYASAGRAILINLTGQVTADGVDTDTLSSIENAIGSRFNDTIHGNDGDNVLDGGAEGSDQIFGGLGSDTMSYAASARSVLINLPGQVTADGVYTDTLSSIENATGSQFNDQIIGTAAANTLNGGAGSDTINGGSGNDFINGGRGNDVMDGGANNDIFFFENASFPTARADLYSGNDIINGFEKLAGAAGDQLQLQTPSSGIWSAAEAGGSTVFTLKVFSITVATVTVTGVTGMVNGDDYLLI